MLDVMIGQSDKKVLYVIRTRPKSLDRSEFGVISKSGILNLLYFILFPCASSLLYTTEIVDNRERKQRKQCDKAFREQALQIAKKQQYTVKKIKSSMT